MGKGLENFYENRKIFVYLWAPAGGRTQQLTWTLKLLDVRGDTDISLRASVETRAGS